jgi:hypothetical protein
MTSDRSPHDIQSLWQDQPSQFTAPSADELRRTARKFTRTIYRRNVREYVGIAILVAAYGYFAFHFHAPLIRLGAILVVASGFWIGWQLHQRGAPAAMDAALDPASCIDYHRAELVRQHRLLSTIWRWYLLPMVPGLALFLFGLVHATLAKISSGTRLSQALWGVGAIAVVCVGTFLFVAQISHWAARKLKQQIDALDTLQKPPARI